MVLKMVDLVRTDLSCGSGRDQNNNSTNKSKKTTGTTPTSKPPPTITTTAKKISLPLTTSTKTSTKTTNNVDSHLRTQYKYKEILQIHTQVTVQIIDVNPPAIHTHITSVVGISETI